MKARFELKIFNNVELKPKATLCGRVGQDVVHLVLENENNTSSMTIELSAGELILAASRLAGGTDGLVAFPK